MGESYVSCMSEKGNGRKRKVNSAAHSMLYIRNQIKTGL